MTSIPQPYPDGFSFFANSCVVCGEELPNNPEVPEMSVCDGCMEAECFPSGEVA